jgi:hypothetical protein
MNTAILSAISALAGSGIGAIASIATTWLSQHYQDRAQRLSRDSSRREQLFSQFIDLASKLYADALIHDELTDVSVLMPLYALKSRINLFATTETIREAERVMRHIIDMYYTPNRDFHNRQAVREGDHDLLQAFTAACRAELIG